MRRSKHKTSQRGWFYRPRRREGNFFQTQTLCFFLRETSLINSAISAQMRLRLQQINFYENELFVFSSFTGLTCRTSSEMTMRWLFVGWLVGWCITGKVSAKMRPCCALCHANQRAPVHILLCTREYVTYSFEQGHLIVHIRTLSYALLCTLYMVHCCIWKLVHAHVNKQLFTIFCSRAIEYCPMCTLSFLQYS